MGTIIVKNLSFSYDDEHIVFDNVSFNIDTSWNLGLIGRNGRGKTTFLYLLMHKYEYSGSIISPNNFVYFPCKIDNYDNNSYQILNSMYPNIDDWMLDREVSYLNIDSNILKRPFKTLSYGEQNKILLAILFLNDNDFLLIDEPTNHLDYNSRDIIGNYLKKKHGFILVSHDRKLLDCCVDHILSINNNNITISQGNFTTWYENKNKMDNYEINLNNKLKKEIKRLDESAKQAASWSNKIEKSKNNIPKDILQDKGYIGHKSAKMMKKAKVILDHKAKAISEKSKLLKNIETYDDIMFNYDDYYNNMLIDVSHLSFKHDDKIILNDISFTLNKGDRLLISGGNGTGKSTLIKLLIDNSKMNYDGNIHIANNLKVSYIPQDCGYLKGSLNYFINNNQLDETLFKTILIKLGFRKKEFDKNISELSDGEKKKILIAKSLTEKANVYIWDEPLNFIDIYSRIQIENAIINDKITMIFVEHDQVFADKISNKVIKLDNK